MKNKKLLILSSLFLTFAMTSCGNNFPSHVSYPEGDNGEVQTPYQEYDNGKRVESISFKENNVSLNLSEGLEYQIEAIIDPTDAHNPDLTYKSNNEAIAIVDELGKVTMLAPGSAVITVSADNGVSADFNISGFIPVTSISVAPHVEGGAVLDIYDTKQFSVLTEPENATQKDVYWSVSDENGNLSTIATISDSGLLSFENAKGVHDEVLYVNAISVDDPSIFASEKVIVNDARKYATSVKIQKDALDVSEVDVYLGDPVQLNAAIEPSDHTNPVSWSTEDASVASVEDGLVSAIKAPAETNVKAAIDGIEGVVKVNTKKIDVQSVVLDKHTLVLNKGEEADLVATVAPENASFKDVIFSVTEGNEYVSVDQDGHVKAKYQTGTNHATIVAVSQDNNDKLDSCEVTVTNKVTAIEVVNVAGDFYYGENTYELALNKTPFDCEAFSVTWESDHPEIASIDASGVVTTNNSALTGVVTFTATVDGTSISNSIEVNVLKPIAPFEAGKQYLVGNRNFASKLIDYDHPSWEDSDYALVMDKVKDSSYINEWVLEDVHLEKYDSTSETGDLFKFRSESWSGIASLALNPFSTKSAHMTEDGNANIYVDNSENYDLYYQDLGEGNYQVYIASEFAKGTYYVVGNRDYSSGVATGSEASWHDVSKALALDYIESETQYKTTVTFDKDDEFKIRSDVFSDIALGSNVETTTIAHKDELTGNIVINEAGKYDIYFKNENGVMTVYMHDYVEPTPFMWGIAAKATDWKLDTTHPFVLSEAEGSAEYTYKLDNFELAKDAEWKVKNTNGEWISNIEGQVGIDLSASTAGAFSISSGNIKVETAGFYDITLNIYSGGVKDGSDWISGMQIIAIKHVTPPTPIDPESVSIDQSEPLSVENGKTLQLSATLAPEGASGTLVWSTSDNTIIDVDSESGLLTGKADTGSATISVALDGHPEISDSISVNAAPDSFAWGIAGSATSWALDDTNKFVKSETPEGEALYTYKISDYDFKVDDTWKVTNTNNEWVNNEEGVVGLDFTSSTYGAFELDSGNIKVKTAGTYTVTLNIYEGAVKDEFGNFTSGVQIIAVKHVVDPTSVSIDQEEPQSVENGKTLQLTATIGPSGASGTLVWSTNDDTIIGVDSATGLLTGKADTGSATISVALDGHPEISDSISVNAAPNSFAWGIAGSATSWALDDTNKFVKSETPEGGALYTYKISEYTFEVDDTWKVTNTNGEWVNNASSPYGVGINIDASSTGAFSVEDGNIKVLNAGTYEITLNVFEGAEKDGNNFIKGMEIIAKDVSDHSLHVKHGASEWSDVKMTLHSPSTTEYKIVEEFEADDIFVVHYSGTTWYDFNDVKAGCSSLVELSGTNDIKIKEDGIYTIYADSVADGSGDHIWISKANIAFNAVDPKVAVGETLDIDVTATGCSDITYTSSNEDFVIITASSDSSITVQGVAEGSSTITATAANGVTNTIVVEATDDPITYTVKFVVNYDTSANGDLYFLGTETGWTPDANNKMTWNSGNNWSFELTLEEGTEIGFKFYRSYAGGGGIWEKDGEGNERHYTFTSSTTVTLTWGIY